MSSSAEMIPAFVLDAYGVAPGTVQPLAGGHINLTFAATRHSGERCVLQRVNEIFPAVVNDDIHAVSAHLRNQGLVSPPVLMTTGGARWVEREGHVWRALGFIDGETFESIDGPDHAFAAGRLLGQFHRALTGLDYQFQSVRSDPHDTGRHLRNLAAALRAQHQHPAFAEVEPLARRILAAGGVLPAIPDTPPRIVHGDPKISNVLFDRDTGAGLCLVDLDTLGRRSIVTELGDAFRSWCNPAGEDAEDAAFSAALFSASIAGYAAGSETLLTDAERESIPAATHRIAVELAARFCADALNETFFRWDATRFESASAHNLARTRAQLSLAEETAGRHDELLGLVAEHLP